MKHYLFLRTLIHFILLTGAVIRSGAAQLPPKDLRAVTVQKVETQRAFPRISSKAEWEARAKDIREQILVSCGLSPLPEKTPLNAKIFGRIERGDYSVENVFF